MEGEIVEALRNRMFRVRLDNGHETLGYTSGKMKRFRIRMLLGDRVRIELSPYDLDARPHRLPPQVAPPLRLPAPCASTSPSRRPRRSRPARHRRRRPPGHLDDHPGARARLPSGCSAREEVEHARELAAGIRARSSAASARPSASTASTSGTRRAELRRSPPADTLVLTTTNGTKLLLSAAARCERVLVGSLLNLSAVAMAARGVRRGADHVRRRARRADDGRRLLRRPHRRGDRRRAPRLGRRRDPARPVVRPLARRAGGEPERPRPAQRGERSRHRRLRPRVGARHGRRADAARRRRGRGGRLQLPS